MSLPTRRRLLPSGETRLRPGELEIAGLQTKIIFSMESLRIAARDLRQLGSFLGKPREHASTLSENPEAYRVRTFRTQFHASLDELRTFANGALTAKEYFRLKTAAGMFEEINPEFYDPYTGVAVQKT